MITCSIINNNIDVGVGVINFKLNISYKTYHRARIIKISKFTLFVIFMNITEDNICEARSRSGGLNINKIYLYNILC